MVIRSSDGPHLPAKLDINRVQYDRLDHNGIRTKTEGILDSDNKVRLQQHDGWELVPWNVDAWPGEEDHVRRLIRRKQQLFAETGSRAPRDLDEELVFELLSTPEVCAMASRQLQDMAREVAMDRYYEQHLFVILERIQHLNSEGNALVAAFFEIKKKIRNWIIRVEELELQSTTFTESAGTDVLLASV